MLALNWKNSDSEECHQFIDAQNSKLNLLLFLCVISQQDDEKFQLTLTPVRANFSCFRRQISNRRLVKAVILNTCRSGLLLRGVLQANLKIQVSN